MQPVVLINQHRQTALIVGESGKKQLVVELHKGKLTVKALSAAEITQRGYVLSNYSPQQAASSYLCHAAGVGERAKGYLEQVAYGAYSDTLAF